jgi:hypothetical protein
MKKAVVKNWDFTMKKAVVKNCFLRVLTTKIVVT